VDGFTSPSLSKAIHRIPGLEWLITEGEHQTQRLDGHDLKICKRKREVMHIKSEMHLLRKLRERKNNTEMNLR
jgi:hypothetical protein